MAIPEYKNGHFEEMAAWSQIPQIVGNSTLLYLSFDAHDSPGAVFIEKWEIFSPNVPVWDIWRRQIEIPIKSYRIYLPFSFANKWVGLIFISRGEVISLEYFKNACMKKHMEIIYKIFA